MTNIKLDGLGHLDLQVKVAPNLISTSVCVSIRLMLMFLDLLSVRYVGTLLSGFLTISEIQVCIDITFSYADYIDPSPTT